MSDGLVLERVTAGDGPLQVIHDVDLEVAPGEVVCLLGPNGAGKSTTLLAAVGQLATTAGRITIASRQVSHRHPNRTAALGAAFVPDNRGLFLQLDGRREPAARAPLAAAAG